MKIFKHKINTKFGQKRFVIIIGKVIEYLFHLLELLFIINKKLFQYIVMLVFIEMK